MKSKLLTVAALCLAPLSVSHASSDTFVHLFEWQWNAIASECENHLAPAGYKAVQVSPPQKSVSGSAWWTRYQPISYAIEGRSGSRAEFASMVQRCAAVGVDIYVDAVINHMAALNRNYPEVPYGPNDFNNCTTNINYSDAWQVQNCDLVGLNDLKTSSDYVRGKIADYMNDLTSLGVKGFRIDAAKHMPAADIDNILSRLHGNPYIFQEVIGAASEPIKTTHYNHLSDVTEFNFSDTLGHYFKGRAQLKDLRHILTWGGWLPSHDAQIFVANHDNQRQNTSNIITHKDGHSVNQLAHAFMLAYPYGYPSVMSSFDWNDHDQGPPASTASYCDNGWLCEHRQREIANMVGFRKATQSAFYLSNWWDNGGNQIAFGRGDKGFIFINGENNATTHTLQTGLSEGSYCDVYSADFTPDSCSGNIINVSSNGLATFTVSGKRAIAIHVNAKVGASSSSSSSAAHSSSAGAVSVHFSCNYGTTTLGQSVYVIGNVAQLGNWTTSQAVKLNPTTYPTWSGSITVPANSTIEWKCLKRSESNPTQNLVWQSGSNNTLTTGNSNTSASASF